MAKVFQKDGKLKRKNLGQKNILGAKFRIGSAFLEFMFILTWQKPGIS